MFRRLATSTSGLCTSSSALTCGGGAAAAVAVAASVRTIRTQIPPRPLVTVVTYLDRGGNPIRNRVETELALVKTRDNKFYLQRIMPDGSYIRWRVPGLDKMKNASSFETFSMHDIDEGGGVQIPHEVMPWSRNTPPEYADGILIINRVKSLGKVTRKDRRYYCRELYAALTEHHDKLSIYWKGRALMFGALFVWAAQRAFAAYTNGRSFFDSNVYSPRGRIDESQERFYKFIRFGDEHPEHNTSDHKEYMASPGQVNLGLSRIDLHGQDVHTPDIDSIFAWQVQHMWHYGHWPKRVDAP